MGLIKAFTGSLSGTLADQWKEYFVCDSLDNDTLVVKGRKMVTDRSSNTKGSENIITDGSKFVVGVEQCAIVVDQGRITEICAEPGGYEYNNSSSPTVFEGGFGKGILNSIKDFGERFTFGGVVPRDQRIYYINTKPIIDNKFGTQNPVPFRVTYADLGRSFTVNVRCNGTYTFKITDPVLFFSAMSNVSSDFDKSALEPQIKSEFLSALQPAFAKLSNNIRYDELPGHTLELCDAMNEVLSKRWEQDRGMKIKDVFINSITIPKEDEDKIKLYEDKAWNRDATNAAATMVEAQAEAMKAAANNKAGAMMGFMGMNMAQANGGFNAQNLFAMGQQQQAQMQAQQQAQQAANSWTCSCGAVNTGKFCTECAKPKPAPAGQWTCSCGTVNTGKFCTECAKPKPADNASEGWTCSCGTVNTGKFCTECAKPRPSGAPVYKCDKCGWTPEDPKNPPKFCPECGDVFDANDAQ